MAVSFGVSFLAPLAVAWTALPTGTAYLEVRVNACERRREDVWNGLSGRLVLNKQVQPTCTA